MDFKELIVKRHSVRKYTEGGMPAKEDIVKMIEAAKEAPSWKNSQTGRYYVVLDDALAEKIRTEALLAHNGTVSRNAALIVSSYVRDMSGFQKDGTPDNEAGNLWGAYDLGLQNENLLLMAKELGYDTLVMGLRKEAVLRELLSIPENEIILPVIAVGTSAEEAKKPGRKDTENILKFF